MPSIFLILAMIFLIAGLINFSSQFAIGLASSADTVAVVAITAVVVTASRGGRYLPPIVNSWGTDLTIVMHSPSRRISSSASKRGVAARDSLRARVVSTGSAMKDLCFQ